MNFTNKQIEKGFWYYDPKNDFPPKPKFIDEYKDEEKLSLVVSKGKESISEVKQRERSYPNEIVSKLRAVKVLWVHNINQEIFNSICNLENLVALYVQSNRIIDISSIKKLKQLEHLALFDLTKIETISPLSELINLKSLKLEHLKKISDFSTIENLSNLEGLQIDGDMYTAQIIDDFNFIASLVKLKYLTLTNTRCKVKDFTPMTKLSNLEMFQCSKNYPKTEFQKLNILRNLKNWGSNINDKIKNES